MAIREVGPGKTYNTLADALAATTTGDTWRCFFNAVDTSFCYIGKTIADLTIEAAPGFAPAWQNTSTLCRFEGRNLTIKGLIWGQSGNNAGTILIWAPASALGGKVSFQDCILTVGTGAASPVAAIAGAVATTSMEVEYLRCTQSSSVNKFAELMSITNATGAQLLGAGTLTITDSTLRANAIRLANASGLFAAQTIRRSIVQVLASSGMAVDFAPGSTSTLEQSILDGMTTARKLIVCDCAKTTLSVKNSYIMRSSTTPVVLTNHTPGVHEIENSAISTNVTAGVSCATTATENCLFGGNGNDYVGGGVIDATDATGSIPTYTDLAGGDYSPTLTSPTRDIGVDEGFVTDLVGNPIPWGTGYDVGPYEFKGLIDPVVYSSEGARDATIICADLSGAPLPGFNPYDLFPAMGDPLVTLAQIVLISLFTDRAANPDDALPAGQEDRRGWFADTSTEKMGSRFWLDEGAAVDDDTLLRNRHYAEEALSHMTRDGLATSIEIDMDIVTDETRPSEARLESEIRVRLDRARGVILKFPDLWGL